MRIAVDVERSWRSKAKFQLSRLGAELGFSTEYARVTETVEDLRRGVNKPDQVIELRGVFPRGIYPGEKVQRLSLKLDSSSEGGRGQIGDMYCHLSDRLAQQDFGALQDANSYVRKMILAANE